MDHRGRPNSALDPKEKELSKVQKSVCDMLRPTRAKL
jgi:hypothetical protein